MIMRLCVVFAVVALASARPDVSEISGYKYAQYSSGPAIQQFSGSAQYASGSGSQFGGGSQFAGAGSGSLEVIPLNLAHVSSQVLRSGEGGFSQGGIGQGAGASYAANNYQYSSGSGSGSGFNGGANLGSQYYNAGGNLGQQYSSGVSQFSSGAGLGAQYATGAGLGAQYSAGSQALFTDSAESSGFAAQGSSGDASGYQQLINDVLNGRYTVGSFSSGGAASAQKQKISINIQPNQAPVTFRHVYFAEAPAEAPIRPRITIDGGIQQRKHVKVVFIKTPDQGGFADQELTLPQLEEEKTKIYVLSKEHNQQPQIRIKAGNAGTASRPEIFFLRYRSEADALKAQQALQAGAAQGSFSSGGIVTDAAGFSGGQASGFTGQAAGGSGSFSSGLASGLSSGISSGISSGSSNAFQSGISSGLSSGSFQSGGSLEGASIASLPLKQETSFASSGSKGVTTLYASPSVGEHSSAGYAA